MNNIEEIKTLNPYQQEAVLDESPACLVNANVGSGKTTVLIEKVRHLHEKKQVSYEKMAVLTFTNKAADEIAERLSRKEAELTEEELWGFGTFHSVALRISSGKGRRRNKIGRMEPGIYRYHTGR